MAAGHGMCHVWCRPPCTVDFPWHQRTSLFVRTLFRSVRASGVNRSKQTRSSLLLGVDIRRLTFCRPTGSAWMRSGWIQPQVSCLFPRSRYLCNTCRACERTQWKCSATFVCVFAIVHKLHQFMRTASIHFGCDMMRRVGVHSLFDESKYSFKVLTHTEDTGLIPFDGIRQLCIFSVWNQADEKNVLQRHGLACTH